MTILTCNSCKHLQLLSLNCQAFPDGIPMMFLTGAVSHDFIVETQENDVVYEPLKKNRSEQAEPRSISIVRRREADGEEV
ncbi:MAG: hypothetical protein ACRC11_11035 [Xenococcaceae cyanobacterium]